MNNDTLYPPTSPAVLHAANRKKCERETTTNWMCVCVRGGSSLVGGPTSHNPTQGSWRLMCQGLVASQLQILTLSAPAQRGVNAQCVQCVLCWFLLDLAEWQPSQVLIRIRDDQDLFLLPVAIRNDFTVINPPVADFFEQSLVLKENLSCRITVQSVTE